jgi:transcriptional regulator with XRE-family HTH domain
MDHYQLSGSAFAERIQVQRSSISHLLSGRNKPSLDFVMRVVKEFDEVELYWLLNGKGNFPDNSIEADKAPDQEVPEAKPTNSPPTAAGKKEIERIVVFYSDGSFKSYLP